MGHASDTSAAEIVDLSAARDVRRAIQKLTSLHEGDLAVADVVACGERAIPALRKILFARDPSGLYEARRRTVEALAKLGALDSLIDFLRAPHDVSDPVEQTGEEAVVNAAARTLADFRDERVIPLLLELTHHHPLAGVVEALGKLRRAEALPYFIQALAEDFTRRAAEIAIRKLGPRPRAALLETACLSFGPLETESRQRQRRSALQLFVELGPPEPGDWPRLHELMREQDPEMAFLASEICVAGASEPGQVAAVQRLIDLLPSADWLLEEQIEDCLVKHFDRAKTIITSVLRRVDRKSKGDSAEAEILQALRRVALRAASVERRTRR